MELLKKRFGKKFAIQKTSVNELLNTGPVFNDGDTVKLRNLYDFVESKYSALQALQVKEQNYLERVVPSWRDAWIDSLDNHNRNELLGVECTGDVGSPTNWGGIARGTLLEATWIQRPEKGAVQLFRQQMRFLQTCRKERSVFRQRRNSWWLRSIHKTMSWSQIVCQYASYYYRPWGSQ